MFLDRFVRVQYSTVQYSTVQYSSLFMCIFVRKQNVSFCVIVWQYLRWYIYFCFDKLSMISILNSGRVGWIINLCIGIRCSYSKPLLSSSLPLHQSLYLSFLFSFLFSFPLSMHTQLVNDRVVVLTLLALEFLNEVLTSNITTIQSKWNGKHLKRFRST